MSQFWPINTCNRNKLHDTRVHLHVYMYQTGTARLEQFLRASTLCQLKCILEKKTEPLMLYHVKIRSHNLEHPHNVRSPESTCGRGTQDPWRCEDELRAILGCICLKDKTFLKLSHLVLKTLNNLNWIRTTIDTNDRLNN